MSVPYKTLWEDTRTAWKIEAGCWVFFPHNIILQILLCSYTLTHWAWDLYHFSHKKNVHSFNNIMLVLFLCYTFSLKFSDIIPVQRRKNTTRFRVVRVIFVAVVVKSNIQTVLYCQRNKNAVCENNNKSNCIIHKRISHTAAATSHHGARCRFFFKRTRVQK